MSIFGFEISKDLFKHGILQVIGRPVSDDKGILRQGWSFGRISALNALDQPKSIYSSGVVKPFHTPCGGIGDIFHDFHRFGADLVCMRWICDGRDIVTRQCVLFDSALHACTSNEFLFFLIPFDDDMAVLLRTMDVGTLQPL